MTKKLIEVALPLEAINRAAAREKQPGIGAHPRGLHLWWARRPLAAARAVLFAQMVDDPSGHPDIFKTEKAQEKERHRLFKIIEDLVQWENTANETVLRQAREEIWKSWRMTCAENADHPRAKELFDRHKLPAFHDPFAGGGALPLEAQRLGLDAYASDLNPVAVLINKAMIEIPPKFAGRPPVNPEGRSLQKHWRGAEGLADDVRYYGKWMRDEAHKLIGHLYPHVQITVEMAKERKDLRPLVGHKLTVIAWIWVRTVKSPNPAFSQVDVPLASTFMLSTRPGKEAYVQPVIEGALYRFAVKAGEPKHAEAAKNGTKLSRGANFKCVMSGTPIDGDYIKGEGMAGRIGARLMAIVAEGDRGRVYLPPTEEHEEIARRARPAWQPAESLPVEDTANFWCALYGLTTFGDLFTPRQLVAMTTFSDLVQGARKCVQHDTVSAGLGDDGVPLSKGGSGAAAYADGVGVYLAFAVDRLADYNSSIATWKPSGEQVMQTYKRQAIPMTWDFPESNVFGDSAICWKNCVKYSADNLEKTAAITGRPGVAEAADAVTQEISSEKLVSTDPPYFDNIGYADLADFFYVWLRKSQQQTFTELFSTVVSPKTQELVASPFRHGGREGAEAFFLDGMTRAMHQLANTVHPAFPVTVYYAFKQTEEESETGSTSTGWETFLRAIDRAGFGLSGTWPLRTELANRIIGRETNALASSIVLVCRPRPADATTVTRREYAAALKAELPSALAHLQRSNIAPVDLAQAAVGPGMAVYTRYANVLDSSGGPLSVKAALALINEVLDETLAAQEGDFDADTRWALAWFEQSGFDEGEYGVADVLARAKATAVDGLVRAGIVKSGRGKVRLLTPDELDPRWDPATDARLTAWETVHQLVARLARGEAAAADLVSRLGAKAEAARELAYRLFTMCERKKRNQEALAYNNLVQSWPEIVRLAGEKPAASQAGLFG